MESICFMKWLVEMFRSYFYVHTYIFVALSLFPLRAFAISPDELTSEQDILGDIPVSYTATRLSQSVQDSPVSVTIIDQEMIEAYAPQELVDILRLVPGFQVIHPTGFRSSTSYLGLGNAFAQRMQVQIDGRSVYSPIFGHVEWAELPIAIEDIERIEVIRGPNAASYGANSFTAIVNIITHHASHTPGAYIKITNGDRNTKKYLARFGGHHDRLDYRFTTHYQTDSGFDSANFPDSKELKSVNFRADYQPDPDNHFEFHAGYKDTRHEDGNIIEQQVNPERNVDGRTHYQSVRWNHQVGDNEKFSLQFYHNYQRIDDVYETDFIDNLFFPGFATLLGVTNQKATIEDSRLLHRYDLELQHSKQLSDHAQIVWGASARYEESGAAGFFDTQSNHDFITNSTYRLFAHGEWKPSHEWTINAGAMLEHNDVSGTDISPRLALNYHFSPNHTVRASASRALRTPSVLEVRADRVAQVIDASGNDVEIDQILLGNDELEPEKLTSLELAYIGHFPRYGINLEAKLFHNRIENIIFDVFNHMFTDPVSAALNPVLGDDDAPLNSDSVRRFENTGTSTLKGFELQLDYSLSPVTRLHAGHTILSARGKRLKEINRDFQGHQVFVDTSKEVPKSISTLQVIHDLEPNIRTSLAFHQYSEYDFEAGDIAGPFSILNARIAKKFTYQNGKGQLSASFQNLLDDYFDFTQSQVFEKRIFIAFEYGFN